MQDVYAQRILIITIAGLVAFALLFAALQSGLL